MIARILPLALAGGLAYLLWHIADRIKERAGKRAQYYSPGLKVLAVVIAVIAAALLFGSSGLLQAP